MNKFLLIQWLSGVELINVKLDRRPSENEITETSEYWSEHDVTVKYKTSSERKINSNGSQQIKIHYKKQNNKKLIEEYGELKYLWGTTTIIVNADLESATADWKVKIPKEEYDGKALSCLVLLVHPKKLFEIEIERETVSRIKKKQSEFKQLLLNFTPKYCAITKETTLAVLDAAHIVEAHEGGSISLNNGILLRSDIHRLYDARLFRILQDGSIEINNKISDEYRKILKNKKVDPEIIKRISAALKERGN